MRDAGCTRCPLHATTQHVCLLGDDLRQHEIMIVGEAPGEHEDSVGKAFVGRAGQLLRSHLETIGINGYITNAVSCRPPDNRTPTKKEISACQYWVQRQLDVVKPKWVLLLGNVALESLLGVKGITKMRGQTFERNGVNYFPTYHPSFVLREPSNERIFADDLARFKQLVAGEKPVASSDFNPVLVDTPAKFDDLLNDLSGAPSFDIETTGLYPWRGTITSLGFGVRRAQYIVPWQHEESPWRGKLNRLIGDLDEPLNQCELIMQNGKFDALWMRVKHGVEWYPAFDTMLAHYAIDENAPHDLEYLSTLYFGAPSYDVPLEVKQGKRGIKALVEYQALDLYYTRKLKAPLAKKLAETPGIERVFKKILMPCSKLFTEIEFDGVHIDTSKFDEAEKYLNDEIAKASAGLKQYQPPPTQKGRRLVDFNWGSPQQVGKLLFEDLGIPVVERTPTGNASTSESVLKRIDHPLVAALLRFRGAKQQLSFFIEGWRPYLVGNKLHPSFKLHGTVTGRLSAEHPNLQQVPRDPRIRQLVSAAEDEELIEADLSQIELRIAAELSGDQQLVYAFNNGIDVHWLTLLRELSRTMAMPDVIIDTASTLVQHKVTYAEAIDILLKSGPDAAAEVNRDWKELRKKAKATNFGYLYGMWWKKFIIYARDNYGVILTPEEAEESRNSFFELYQDLPCWHKRQQSFARRNGFVVSLSGRRRRLPDAMSRDKTPSRDGAWRQAINSPVQSFANELNLMSALQLREEYPRSIVKICGTVHDAILARVKRTHVVEVSERLLEIMRHPKMLDEFGIELKVPIEADLKIGPWSKGVSLKKWKLR